jgi:hypothetical protein
MPYLNTMRMLITNVKMNTMIATVNAKAHAHIEVLPP